LTTRYLIIWSKQGQLANRLLFFAHALAFASCNGFKVINLTFYSYTASFDFLDRDYLCRYPSPKNSIQFPLLLRKILYRIVFIAGNTFGNCSNRLMTFYNYSNEKEVKLYTDPSCYDLISKSKFIFLKGWMLRDYTSLALNKSLILDFFTLKKSVKDKIISYMNSVKSEYRLVIGIHVRRGDYKNFMQGKYYYSDNDYMYIMSRMMYLVGNNIIFLICSNEKVDTTQFEDYNVATGSGNPIEDLYCLSLCDYIIGPPSTFSLWASFVGNKLLYHIEDSRKPFVLNDFFISQG
jgi:hypothetical protein